MENEFNPNVRFRAVRSSFSNCICEGCHKTGTVTMFDVPETKYFNGRTLRTRKIAYWLCDDCLKKLAKAVEKSVNEMEGED